MSMKRPGVKNFLIFLMFICLPSLILVIILTVGFILSLTSPNANLHATGRNNVNFTVYYLENNVFGGGAATRNLHYLMSFTDFIEIENSFFADFSHSGNISYTYTATETLHIKHMRGNGNGNGNGNANPVVYEEQISLKEISGETFGNHLYFGGYEGENVDFGETPGGIYILHPKAHIVTYRHFVEEQTKQMKKEDVVTSRPVTFSAELVVNFTYSVHIKENGFSETITRGLVIPLSDEVFSPEDTGSPMFEVSVQLREFMLPGLLSVILLVLWLAAPVAGICYCIRRIKTEKDPRHSEFNNILKKYSDEITILLEPIDLHGCKIQNVPHFTELLKLAINLNNHILCYHNEEKAQFCVISEGYAHCYEILFDDEDLDFHQLGISS